MTDNPFWEIKSLAQMEKSEWESLCDGCAKCCLVQLEDEDSQQLVYTDIACDYLNESSCRCRDYQNRSKIMPTCMTMTIDNVAECAQFAPETCAYRLLLEDKPLPEWHHLICGDVNEIHRRGLSVKSKVTFSHDVAEEDYEEHVVHWPQK